MSEPITLLPLLLLPALYAVLFKLAALIYRRIQLSWKHALLFGLLVLVVGALGALANMVLGALLPALLLGLVGVAAVQLALGGWYFGPRASTASGQPIGFAKGVLLSAIAYGIVFAVGIVAAVVVPALHDAGRL